MVMMMMMMMMMMMKGEQTNDTKKQVKCATNRCICLACFFFSLIFLLIHQFNTNLIYFIVYLVILFYFIFTHSCFSSFFSPVLYYCRFRLRDDCCRYSVVVFYLSYMALNPE